MNLFREVWNVAKIVAAYLGLISLGWFVVKNLIKIFFPDISAMADSWRRDFEDSRKGRRLFRLVSKLHATKRAHEDIRLLLYGMYKSLLFISLILFICISLGNIQIENILNHHKYSLFEVISIRGYGVLTLFLSFLAVYNVIGVVRALSYPSYYKRVIARIASFAPEGEEFANLRERMKPRNELDIQK